MSTDDLADTALDARLRAAGERWRAANDTASGVDVTAATPLPGHGVAEDVEELAPPRRRGHRAWLVSAAAVAAAAVGIGFAISSSTPARTPSATREAGGTTLIGTQWVLRQIRVDGRELSIDGRPTLTFDGQELSGNDGCNHFSGRATADAATLTVSDLATTAMACVGTGGRTPSFALVDSMLQGEVHWSIEDGLLTVSGEQGSLVYSTAATATTAGLTGAVWALTGATSADGQDVPIAGRPTLQVSTGHFTAEDGCNTVSGRLTLQGASAAPNDVGVTERACAAVPPSQASALLIDGVLGMDWRWRIQGANLTVANDRGTLSYTRAPTGGVTAGPDDVAGSGALLGRWTLTSLEHRDANGSSGSGVIAGSGAGSPAGLGTTITITAHAIDIAHACFVDRATLRLGTTSLDITDVTLQRAVPCASRAGSEFDAQADAVLTGTSRWTLDRGALTITKGRTTLRFERAAGGR
jgi:heat shock protein HslJ